MYNGNTLNVIQYHFIQYQVFPNFILNKIFYVFQFINPWFMINCILQLGISWKEV